MYRYILFIIAVLCSKLTAVGEPVSPAAVRQAAQRMLQSKGARLGSEAIQAPRRSLGMGAVGLSQTEASPYYVFNAEGGKGFVVVSGDDCVGENLVIGYADRGSFDAGNVPANMQSWLDATEQVIERMSRNGLKPRAMALHDDISPLVSTRWGQGKKIYNPEYPYNALCPLIDGALTVTGCMATALSQVMYYHRWPQEAFTGELPAYTSFTSKTVMESLPSVKFDWDNMLDDYHQSSTEEQQLAVATLMRYCGQMLQMDYTPNVSNAYAYDESILVGQFGYDQGMYPAHSNDYSLGEWDKLLYGELNERRPLIHMGFSTSTGHAFILDGYEVHESVGYYHVNWGWDGQSDGFYRIDLLNPYELGTGGGSTTDGFSISQCAIIGMQPSMSPGANYYRYVNSVAWNNEYKGQPHCCAALNSSYMPGTFAIGLAERAADGTIDYSRVLGIQEIEFPGYSLTAWFMDMESLLRIITMPEGVADGLTAGSHRFVYVNREAGTDAPWRPVFGTNCSVEINVGEDGVPTDTIFHPQAKLTANARSVKVTGLGGLDDMMMRGLKLTVEASIANKGEDDYTGVVYCCLYTTYDDVLTLQSSVRVPIFIDANGKVDLKFPVSTPTAGNYIAVLTNDYIDYSGKKLSSIKSDPNYIGQKLFTTKELTFYIDNATYRVGPNLVGVPTAYIDFTVSNNTVMDYNTVIMVNVYKNMGEGNYQPFVFPSGVNYQLISVNVASGKRSDVRLYLDQILGPGEYIISFNMAYDYNGMAFSDYFSIYSMGIILHDETGISVVDRGQLHDSEPWFTLDGRRLDARPAAKGIYVHGGQKFVVK